MISSLYTGVFITMAATSYAMQAPVNQNEAKISYNDFIAQKGDQLRSIDRMPRPKQQNSISMIFDKFRNVINDKNRRDIFGLIDELKNQNKIAGEQAVELKRYMDQKLRDANMAVPPANMAAPLGNKQDLLNWTKMIAKKINNYFSKPYNIAPPYIIQCGKNNLPDILRPNHGLAHGLRQGMLTLDIVEALNNISLATTDKDVNDLINWVKNKIKTDPNFRSKIEFAAAFQRTGRQSEENLTDEDRKRDAQYFEESANEFTGPGGIFQNPRDILIYKQALGAMMPVQGFSDDESTDIRFLGAIFEASHWLDLRRLKHNGMSEPFQYSVFHSLFGYPGGQTEAQLMSEVIDKLWERAGEYLRASGDRDQDEKFIATEGKYKYGTFCRLSNNSDKLVDALFSARQNSTVRF